MLQHNVATVRRWFFAGAALLGCAGNLEPAPESRRVPGIASSAVDEQAGIELVAVSDAWRGHPPELDELVTPVLVTLTNRSGRSLELRYEHFALVTPAGVRFAALPPVIVTGVAYGPVDLVYPPMGFGLAPYLSPWYPALSVWGGSFPFRADYYGNCYTSCQHFPLPDGELLQRALPEGVLSPGGRITGFLYFEELEDVRHINLMFELVDPNTGERFGGLDIPFVYDD
ncbi:hypothetical protein OV090_00525 [Nannocystis sp. RBIL2]|uniref:hypothetical protein n=1 Tax=Nannocystis sp. RBIL2 TaxID=2996788 RepID=UPI0022702DD2|nr:hypothetical protein [Nannocystis sp. RBIL2]MCY1063226.1 hypothetical protein [Nannocystis sp. RBIL2]